MVQRPQKLHAYHDHDGTYRHMVAAPNVKEAARLLGTTVGSIRSYGGRYPDDSEEAGIARSDPGRVWERRMTWGPNPEPWRPRGGGADGRG
jgi:hypothetical protein